MANDLNELFRALGRVETAVEEAKVQNVEIKEALRQQNVLAETNKGLAIKAREEKQAEINKGLGELKDLNMETREMTVDNKRWIDTIGNPLVTRVDNIHDRVTAIEDGKRQALAEDRGSLKTWGFIGGIATAIGSALAGVITYGKDALDFVKGIGH